MNQITSTRRIRFQKPNRNPNKSNYADVEVIDIPGSEFCDDTNIIIACSHSLRGHSSRISQRLTIWLSSILDGLNIDGEAIPDTSSAESDNMVILDRLDGFNPRFSRHSNLLRRTLLEWQHNSTSLPLWKKAILAS